MSRVALKGLLFRRSRTILTAIAIVLGVAMVSGTYVLTDTITRAFDSIFNASYEQTSAVITGRSVVRESTGNVTIPESLAARVGRLPGVADAAGAIFDLESSSDKAQIIGHNGKTISTGGSPTFGFGFEPEQTRFNPMHLTAGHWADTGDEVVIDQGTAESEGFQVGEEVGIATIGPTRRFKIAGIAKFGSVPSLGGATIAVFTLPEAQRLLGKEGRVDLIFVAARPGVGERRVIVEAKRHWPDCKCLLRAKEIYSEILNNWSLLQNA